jgi:hypothetical protein
LRRASPQTRSGQTLADDPHATIRAFKNQARLMDAERINQIGSTLLDLTARTEALRGYL